MSSRSASRRPRSTADRVVTVAVMDQESLQASSRRWMHAALEAFGRGKPLDFAVHHAGVGLEHLLKTYLCSLHPALIVDATHWPSLLHAVGHGDRSGVPASGTKSIGLKLAFEHVQTLLKPKISVAADAFGQVLAARNGVAHVGAHDDKAARDVLGTCIRIATPVLTELGIDAGSYWGDYTSLVEQLADEQANELRVMVEAKLARAKRTFEQRFGALTPEQRTGVVAALGATSTVSSDYDLQIDCPACEGHGWLHGISEVDWDVATDAVTAESVPTVVFYADWFTCTVCGLELEGDEFDHANLEHEHYLNDEDPTPYIGPDEDLAYESWREDQLDEL